MLNDGTGHLYVALHDEFQPLDKEAKSFAIQQVEPVGTIIDPNNFSKFIAIPKADGSIDYVADVTATRPESNGLFQTESVLVNVPLAYNPKTDFHQDITISDRNGSTLMRTWAGNDVVHDLDSGAQAHIDGGAGRDTAVYSGNFSDYRITEDSFDSTHVLSLTAVVPKVDDTLVNFEALEFSDRSVELFNSISGTSGNDLLAGTSANDNIQAAEGDDTISASAGADVVDGGAGRDTFKLAGFSHDYALALAGGAGTVSGGPEGGADTLASIENVQFLDGVLTFDTGSTAAQVVRLYDSFLGRAPDLAGFDSYLKFVSQGHSFQDMAANAAASPEFHDATAGLTDTQYVTYVYEHSLHREPDAAGLQTYVADLQNGTFTRTSLIVQAAESPEHVALTAPIVAAGLWSPDEPVEGLELLYDAAVQRQPDASGLDGYGRLIAGGETFRQIANQMAGSAEFAASHAGQTDAQYVDSLYVSEVGRHADAAGLAAYVDELAHGRTRGDVLFETAMSQEHQSHVLAYFDPLLIG